MGRAIVKKPGYKRATNGRFIQGTAGGPGRPAGETTRTWLDTLGNEAVGKQGITRYHKLARVLWALALKGDAKAISYIIGGSPSFADLHLSKHIQEIQVLIAEGNVQGLLEQLQAETPQLESLDG